MGQVHRLDDRQNVPRHGFHVTVTGIEGGAHLRLYLDGLIVWQDLLPSYSEARLRAQRMAAHHKCRHAEYNVPRAA